nr:cytosolic superoxide production complex 39K protein - guinea pig [Cavia porcellus]
LHITQQDNYSVYNTTPSATQDIAVEEDLSSTPPF